MNLTDLNNEQFRELVWAAVKYLPRTDAVTASVSDVAANVVTIELTTGEVTSSLSVHRADLAVWNSPREAVEQIGRRFFDAMADLREEEMKLILGPAEGVGS